MEKIKCPSWEWEWATHDMIHEVLYVQILI